MVGWGPGSGKAYVTIVAGEDGTQVQVRPTATTLSGPGVPPGVAGGVFSVDLDEGDVAPVAVSVEGDSLAGTRIEADKAVGVFTLTCMNRAHG